MDKQGYIAALMTAAIAAVEFDPKIYKAVKERAKREGRTILEQTIRSAQEAVAADLKQDGWKIKNVHDSATWQPPAGTNYADN